MFCEPFTGRTSLATLPDELLREILGHVILGDLPLSKLIDPAARFGETEVQRAMHVVQVLTVSHWWLRVGQPLLYSSVVLRSPAQVSALLRTLEKYPHRGLYIRRLRLEEGAYCEQLKEVLARTPCVKVLFLGLELYSNALGRIGGLCEGLEHLSPNMIVLDDPMSTVVDNATIVKVVGVVGNLVMRSSSLRVFEWRGPRHSKAYELKRTAVFADALSHSPSLTDIAIVGQGNEDVPRFVLKVLENESVRRIRVVNCSRSVRKRLEKVIRTDESLGERILFVQSFSDLPVAARVTRQRKSRRVKKRNVLVLPSHLQRQIMILALSSFKMTDERMFSDGLDETEYPAFDRLCKTFMLVSKLFNSVTRTICIRNIGLDAKPRDKIQEKLRLLRRITQSVSFFQNGASQVRCLHLDVPRAELGADIVDIVCQLNELETLVMPVYPMDIKPLASHLGFCLRFLDFYLEGAGAGASAFRPSDWVGFNNVEVLWIRVGNNISVNLIDNEGDLCLEPVTFFNLRTLIIQDYVDATIYELLCHWDLRNVQNLKIAGFINSSDRTHVRRFFSLITSFNGKFNSLALGCCIDGPDPDLIGCIPVNTTIQKIKLCFPQYERRAYINFLVYQFFRAARFGERFRALKEIQIDSLTSWPYTEAEIRRSPWPAWIDPLIRSHGIEVTDCRKTPWLPRLRVQNL